jgi:hypothetical protein
MVGFPGPLSDSVWIDSNHHTFIVCVVSPMGFRVIAKLLNEKFPCEFSIGQCSQFFDSFCVHIFSPFSVNKKGRPIVVMSLPSCISL